VQAKPSWAARGCRRPTCHVASQDSQTARTPGTAAAPAARSLPTDAQPEPVACASGSQSSEHLSRRLGRAFAGRGL